MRVNMWKAGAVVAAAILLAGCSAPSGNGNESKPSSTSSSSSSEETSTASDCPELKEGETVDIADLSTCSADRMKESAGYAATSTTMGMVSTARYDSANDATEVISDMGSMIIIGDDTWVKSPTSEWQVADPNASDPVIAALSTAAQNAASLDPATAAAALSGEFTVTGTGERLGQKVYLVTGTAETQGVEVDATFEVTADYIMLATSTKTEVQGQAIESVLEITDWDVKQDIVAPI
ncbi:hypothetical protein [Microbacterium galbinum]|uniref:LppX_LprAFG lipoprotein n=1 Tax=Microbacterium galbinum TaxID=2851646 RepID=A0ABY4IS29_9MICO|nr:hypothetical protein [Microbacterium galbinum]UPL14113.1 hypothetical protein KV396_06335 [Microbacterium galbinum]